MPRTALDIVKETIRDNVLSAAGPNLDVRYYSYQALTRKIHSELPSTVSSVTHRNVSELIEQATESFIKEDDVPPLVAAGYAATIGLEPTRKLERMYRHRFPARGWDKGVLAEYFPEGVRPSRAIDAALTYHLEAMKP